MKEEIHELSSGKRVEYIETERGEPCIELFLKESAKCMGIKVRGDISDQDRVQTIFEDLVEKYGVHTMLGSNNLSSGAPY